MRIFAVFMPKGIDRVKIWGYYIFELNMILSAGGAFAEIACRVISRTAADP